MLRSVEPGPEGEVLPFYARFPLTRFASRFNHGLHRGHNVVLSDLEVSLGNRVDRKSHFPRSTRLYFNRGNRSVYRIAT